MPWSSSGSEANLLHLRESPDGQLRGERQFQQRLVPALDVVLLAW
jgi:hypothetical protein